MKKTTTNAVKKGKEKPPNFEVKKHKKSKK